MTDDPTHPANPYAGEAASAPRLEDRPGYPGKRYLSAYGTDLSDAAQLGARCAVCGKPIAPDEAVRDSRGGPWHRLCIPPSEPPAPHPAERAVPPVERRYIRVAGRVKWFDIVHGYGFIAPDNPGDVGGKDVMLTADVLRASRYWPRVPSNYVRITADAMQTARGWRAIAILQIDYVDWQ